MSGPTVLLVYSSNDDKRIMSDFLETYGYSVISAVTSGLDCLSVAKERNPDIIMSDMFIYDFDAVRLHEMLSASDCLKATVYSVYTRAAQARLKARLISLGTDVFTLIPFEYATLDMRLREAMAEKTPDINFTNKDEFINWQIRDFVSRMLDDMHIPSSFNGSSYIVDAVLMSINDADALGSITTVIYPEIARTHGTAARNIERSIRTAIDRSYAKDGGESIRNVTGFVQNGDEKPSNSEFISLIADIARNSIYSNAIDEKADFEAERT